MATCFLVIGTPRSGTSCVAGVLHHLGVVMGRELQSEDGNPRFDWPDSNDWNPAGFFQDAELENLQSDMFANEFPSGPIASLEKQQLDRMQEIIKHRESLGIDWGAKTSRMAYLVPHIREMSALPIKLILTTRLAAESKESWKVRSKCSPERAELIMNRTLAAREYVQGLGIESFEIPFNDLLTNPAQQVGLLAEFCGRKATAEAVAQVKPELRRFNFSR